MTLAVISRMPPGAEPTIIFTGFVGQPWANATCVGNMVQRQVKMNA
jgi:hypothetical protein